MKLAPLAALALSLTAMAPSSIGTVSQPDAAKQFAYGRWLVQNCAKVIDRPQLARQCVDFSLRQSPQSAENHLHQVLVPFPIAAGADYAMLLMSQEAGIDDSRYVWHLENRVRQDLRTFDSSASYCTFYSVDCAPLQRMNPK